MDQPEELILKDVRCFQGEQRGKLRPITLLIGENSTGKSTFLGCLDVVHQMLSRYRRHSYNSSPNFNQDPFSMGSFRDIVRTRRGPSGRIDEFELGIKIERNGKSKNIPTEFIINFGERGSQPVPSSVMYKFQQHDFVKISQSESGLTNLSIPGKNVEMKFPFEISQFQLDWLLESILFEKKSFSEADRVVEYLKSLLNMPDEKSRKRHLGMFDFWHPFRSDLVSIAPLRAKPRRTYDPIGPDDSPEGDDIPMFMMKMHHLQSSRWQALHDDLVEFGAESGLFSDIKVKRHGKQISDPFQLQVKVQSGPHVNMMDVGYGISQSLPILVKLLASQEQKRSGASIESSPRTFLLQQPEVHLHPRGQAELASLFVKFAKKKRNRFVIETHSDFVIDRVRISVRQKKLKPEDVSIIYFEPTKNSVNLHNISVDEDGNLHGAPPGYRSFFLRETDQLLGFGE